MEEQLLEAHREIDDLELQVLELERVLDTYYNNLCQGWCREDENTKEFDNCSGCLARVTLERNYE